MATTGVCNTFKQQILQKQHNVDSGGDTLKAVLIKASPARTFDNTQTNLGTPGTGTPSVSNIGTDEVTGTGYTSGGQSLTNNGVTLSGNVASVAFANYSYTSATISTTAMVIGNNTAAGKAVSVHDFGGTQSVTAGTLSIVFPTAVISLT